MTSGAELVEELRERARNLRRGDWPREQDACLFEEAADFIEALEGPLTPRASIMPSVNDAIRTAG